MKLAYEVIHPPGDRQKNAPPVVMLHGMLESRKTWKYIAPKIAENTGRIVYLVDGRNHGDSPWSDEMDWSILADDVGDFLTEHSIPKAVLIGHSMGGISAFTFALKKPEMVDKLIVEDVSAKNIRLKDGRIILQIVSMLREALNVIPDDADDTSAKKVVLDFIISLARVDLKPSFSSFDVEFIPLKRDGNGYHWKTNFDAIEKFLACYELVHDGSKTGVYYGDSLFLYGTKSFYKVSQDSLLDKLFPKVLKFSVEGGTHMLHHLYPEKFIKIVCNFINHGTTSVSKL